jgi:hypothetical protein
MLGSGLASGRGDDVRIAVQAVLGTLHAMHAWPGLVSAACVPGEPAQLELLPRRMCPHGHLDAGL